MVSTKMDPSYKVDEGYSEDTRSQDDPDSPMRMESGGDDALQTQMITDAVTALGEGEKSGKPFLRLSELKACLTELHRIRVQHPTYPQGLFHSFRCRSIMASVSQRSDHYFPC